MNFYKRHLGDYAKDAAHLSMLEHGAYTLLLDRYYTTENPIAQAEAYRVCRARSREEKAAVDAVLSEFFDVAEGVLRNKRCDEEIGRANAQAETNRQIAAEREARKRARLENESLQRQVNESLPVREPSQTPDTTSQTPVKEKKPSVSGRGSRLPPDWQPGDTGTAFAASQGLSNGRASVELEKFRDHWTAKAGSDASKLDWQAAWRSWVRKAIEFAPKRPVEASPFEGAR